MNSLPGPHPFHLFSPPYIWPGAMRIHRLETEELRATPGAALVWQMAVSRRPRDHAAASGRPGGMALIVVLPPARVLQDGDILSVVDRCRPHSILPYHPEPQPDDLVVVLRRPPEVLAVAVVDYLMWRGIRVDGETRHLIRRTVELSESIRTVSGLARSVYLSRRALGRRFLTRGLPAPSHWLQFGRVLRAAIELQSSQESLFTVATDLGYPDGFALSNQMKRMIGTRPSMVRECLGWEWVVEAWLQVERAEGALRFDLGTPRRGASPRVAEAPTASVRRGLGPRRKGVAGQSTA